MPAERFDPSQSRRGVGPALQRKGVAGSQVTTGRQKRMITKNVVGEIKQLDETGSGTLVFSTMNTMDRDGDVTLLGAFGEQVVPMVPAHDWEQPPIGKASIYEVGNEARADFALNRETKAGENWYEALKFDIEHPPARQQYSYAFDPVMFDFGERNGKRIRFLRKVTVPEISPVLLGAGIDTRTIELRGAGAGSAEQKDNFPSVGEYFDPSRVEQKLEHVQAFFTRAAF
jgi:hypothetical protein